MCPAGAVVASKETLIPTITQEGKDEEEVTPAPSTKAQQIARSVTQEACLAAIEISNTTPTARYLASRKFPLELLCEMAAAVMDSSGELLQYRHLIARPEYQVMWTKVYAKELG